MFLIEWLRWLRGTVTFLITGAFSERLLNLCARNRLAIWDIVRKKEGLTAKTYVKNYRRIARLSKSAGTRTRVRQRTGLPFFCHRHRRRWGLVAGVVVSALLTFFLSTRIWVVSVRGCESIEPDEIVSQLSQLGLHPGVSTRALDGRLLQRKMLLLDDRLAWIAINLVGSTAEIELRERVKLPERLDPSDRAANIVAACDGQIKYLEIYEGQPLVRLGDTVQKGEVIVSGILEDQYGNTQLRYARAKVIAQVYEERTVEVPYLQQQWVASAQPKSRHSLSVLGFELALFLPEGKGGQGVSVVRSKRTLLSIPELAWIEETRTPMTLQETRLTEHQAKEAAMKQLSLLSTGDEIISVVERKAEGTPTDDSYCLTERLIIEKDIATEAEIFQNEATF